MGYLYRSIIIIEQFGYNMPIKFSFSLELELKFSASFFDYKVLNSELYAEVYLS